MAEHFDLDRARLWDALADLEAHREWMTDVRALHFLTAQRSGVGTRYLIEVANGPVRLRDHVEVVTWNRPGELAITYRIGPAARCGPLPAGGRRARNPLGVAHAVRVPWWVGGAVAERLGAPATRRLLTSNLASLRRRLADRGG